MAKGEWEKRVGMLLDPDQHPEFVYSYKPIDGMHGGQTKIDWLACDYKGRFWLIEVKSLDESAKRLNLLGDKGPTAGQRDGLNAVADSGVGVSLLAVGQGSTLYLFDWRDIRWRCAPGEQPLLPMTEAFLTLTWTGPKHWVYSLYALVLDRPSGSATILDLPAKPSPKPELSASISKPGGSIPMRVKMPPLGP